MFELIDQWYAAGGRVFEASNAALGHVVGGGGVAGHSRTRFGVKIGPRHSAPLIFDHLEDSSGQVS